MNRLPQKISDDNLEFENRLEAHRKRILAANSHRIFRCLECGERYTYDWVYEYGLRCDAGCDGELMEVHL